MRHTFAAALLCSVLSTTVHAQQAATSPAALRPFVGIGYTSGGDTLIPVRITQQGGGKEFSEDISAGGGLEARVGLSFKLANMPASVRASYGVHSDQHNGISNGQAFFRRYPVEVLGFYHFSDRASVGVGVRRATRPVLRFKNASVTIDGTKIENFNEDFDLQPSTGIVLEGEWRLTPSWGVSLRYVKEHFNYGSGPGSRIEADHLGINTQWYFR